MSVGVGTAIGAGIGAALLAATGDPWWIAICAGLGAMLGLLARR